MKCKEAATAIMMGLISLTPAMAAEDLSSFGVPIEATGPVLPVAPLNERTSKYWPAHVCAEIERVEKLVISGARPTDRGMTRIGLLMLEQLHCGVDVSKKIAADQAILNEAQRKARRDYEENMAAAQSAASRPQQPIIVQVPQAASKPAFADEPSPVNCLTTRLGGGMSSTSCR